MGDFGQVERDMLIRVDENVKAVCKSLDCHVKKDDSNVKRWMILPILGFLTTLIIGAYGYTYKTSENINDHKSDLQIHRTLDTVKALKE